MKNSNIITSIALLSQCILVVGCSSKSPVKANDTAEPPGPAVQITAKPIYLQKKEYVKPKDANAKNSYTEWKFHCYPDLFYKVQQTEHTGSVYNTTIKVQKVKLEISLPITIRMPADINLTKMDHEQGHLTICSEVYKRGEKVATRAAESVIDKDFTGQADTESGALEDAINKAKSRIGEIYQSDTVEQVLYVEKEYDRLTAKGVPVQPALKQAFQSWQDTKRSTTPSPARSVDKSEE